MSTQTNENGKQTEQQGPMGPAAALQFHEVIAHPFLAALRQCVKDGNVERVNIIQKEIMDAIIDDRQIKDDILYSVTGHAVSKPLHGRDVKGIFSMIDPNTDNVLKAIRTVPGLREEVTKKVAEDTIQEFQHPICDHCGLRHPGAKSATPKELLDGKAEQMRKNANFAEAYGASPQKVEEIRGESPVMHYQRKLAEEILRRLSVPKAVATGTPPDVGQREEALEDDPSINPATRRLLVDLNERLVRMEQKSIDIIRSFNERIHQMERSSNTPNTHRVHLVQDAVDRLEARLAALEEGYKQANIGRRLRDLEEIANVSRDNPLSNRLNQNNVRIGEMERQISLIKSQLDSHGNLIVNAERSVQRIDGKTNGLHNRLSAEIDQLKGPRQSIESLREDLQTLTETVNVLMSESKSEELKHLTTLLETVNGTDDHEERARLSEEYSKWSTVFRGDTMVCHTTVEEFEKAMGIGENDDHEDTDAE